MPESHWVALTVERLEKLAFDSVASKYLDVGVIRVLLRERERLCARHKQLAAEGN